MADTALTALAAATAPDADDLFYLVEDGVSVKATGTQVAALMASIITPADIGAQPAGSVDADDVTYTPTTLADWDGSADPGDVEQALDQLAERVTDVEGASVSDGDKGDITVSTDSNGTVWTIDNDAVSNAKLANVSTQTIKGRTTASSGDPEDLTAAQAAAVIQGNGLTVDLAGFRGIPINSQSGNYTTVAADSGKAILHASGAGAGDTFTIDSNANVAYPLGTAITFINMDSNALSIAITSDTMNLAGAGTTGTRSLAQYGNATAIKVASTTWLISGTGLT